MDSHQLREIIQRDPRMKSVFEGVFARNRVPVMVEKNEDRAYIINMDDVDEPGSHWVLAYFRRREGLYFDSFGKPPESHVYDWLKRNASEVIINDRTVQSDRSRYCGLFVIYVLYYLCRDVNLGQIVNRFVIRDLMLNDYMLMKWLYKHFQTIKFL